MRTNDPAIRRLLREGDPARAEPAPSAFAVAALRRRVLDEAGRPAGRPWAPLLACAGLLALTLLLGWNLTRDAVSPTRPGHGNPRITGRAGPGVRLQFSTPGGTRVIWTLDPAFEVRAKG